MKKCHNCGTESASDQTRFCPECGTEYRSIEVKRRPDPEAEAAETAKLFGDKNLINESTIIGKQEKFEASNITIHNTNVEDHTKTTIVCAVSGKRIFLAQSIECPKCGRQVAPEYYVETSRRCENCEKQACEEYTVLVKSVMGEGPLDAERKRRLDAEAKRLVIDSATQASIMHSSKSTPHAAAPGELSSVQRVELQMAVSGLIDAEDNEDEKAAALKTLAALHEAVSSEQVDYWYFLALAIVEPKQAVASYEHELTENFWQRYWGFLAYLNVGSPKGGAAVDRLHATFGGRKNEVLMAEALYYTARGFEALDSDTIQRAAEIYESVDAENLPEPLKVLHGAMKRALCDRITLDDRYSRDEIFAFANIFHAQRYIQYLMAQRQKAHEEQQRKADAEREEAEREKAAAHAAEQARQRQQEQMAAEREKRMAQEAARLAGTKPVAGTKPAAGAPAAQSGNKAFAGYDAVPPARMSKRTRYIIIGAVVLAVLIAILFLIPAPESLQ